MQTPKEKAYELLDEFKQIKHVLYANNKPIKEEILSDSMVFMSVYFHVQLMINECKGFNSERESFWQDVLFELKKL